MKPRLPSQIEAGLPDDILFIISTYLDHVSKPQIEELNHNLVKEIIKLQSYNLNGKNNMYLRDFDDFIF